MRLAMKNVYEFGIDLHVLFTYFQQAYDVTDRKHIYETFKELGTLKRDVKSKKKKKQLDNMVKITYAGSNFKVTIQEKILNNFKVNKRE
jgi:hypothetical protein